MERQRVLVVEDDHEMLTRMVRSLEGRLGEAVEICPEGDFDQAISRLSSERYDVVVLDVRRGRPEMPLGDGGLEAGRRCYDAVRAVRFVPVVFHTGLPETVRDLQSAVVSIVEKSGSAKALPDAVEGLLRSGLPGLARAMMAHVERVHRDYMWDFGAKAWAQYGADKPHELVHLLARRLALSFESAEIDDLLAGMDRPTRDGDVGGLNPARPDENGDGDKENAGSSDVIGLNPARLYIMPPISEGSHRAGDVYERRGDDLAGYWVLLTPTCDLVLARGKPRKVTEPVLARCSRLTDTDEFRAWHQDRSSKAKRKALSHLMENNRDKQPERYFFLPGAFDLPDLLVDLAALRTVPVDQLNDQRWMTRIASLDTPFAASMLTRFLRYFGRFGTSDLDVGYVFRRLAET